MNKFFVIIWVVFFMYSCKDNDSTNPVDEVPVGKLELIHSYELDAGETSGLSFGPGNNTLLTVSDNTNRIYELDFEGNILRRLNFMGNDLEGVTYNPDEDLIVVVDEAQRKVSFVDYVSGNKTKSFELDVQIVDEASGFEGISYNVSTKNYYIVNEKNPDLLLVWNPDSEIITQEDLEFALDYSGVYVDIDHQLIWYVSDESQQVFKCDSDNNVLMIFNLDERKFEGISISNDTLYLVNDVTSKLNIYKMTSD